MSTKHPLSLKHALFFSKPRDFMASVKTLCPDKSMPVFWSVRKGSKTDVKLTFLYAATDHVLITYVDKERLPGWEQEIVAEGYLFTEGYVGTDPAVVNQMKEAEAA